MKVTVEEKTEDSSCFYFKNGFLYKASISGVIILCTANHPNRLSGVVIPTNENYCFHHERLIVDPKEWEQFRGKITLEQE
jgi:hypothetical protein